MKDMKVDKIMATSNEYLKQRNYETTTDIKAKSEDSAEKSLASLEDELVGLKEFLSLSTPNSFTFSTTSSQYTFLDQQYIRLKSWMTEASEPCRSELSQVLFPLFVYLYLELLSSAGKLPARYFFSRHHQVFHVNRDYEQTLKEVWAAAGETANSPIIQSLKSGKYLVRLSELTVNYFLRYLQTSDNPTLLQIFNNFLEVELSELSGSQSFAVFRGSESSYESECYKEGTNQLAASKRLDFTREELNHVKDIIANSRATKPLIPSVCVYSVYNAYNGLTCSKINHDSRLLVCGFEDSVIKLWRLTPLPQSSGNALEPSEDEVRPSQSILFCDLFKGNEKEGSSSLVKEEEEETKNIGGRHISGGEFCTLRGHRGSVFDTAFTHCSSYLFSVGDDAVMRLWDLEQQSAVALYQGHHYPVWCLDVAPHTIYVATGSYDESVRLWNTECTFPLRVFIGHMGSVDSVAFHPNCSYVASGSSDRTIRLWQVNDAAVARVLLHHSAPIKSLKFSPNGKFLASGSENGEVLIWDLVAGKVVSQVGFGSEGTSGYSSTSSPQVGEPIMSLDWSKDSRVLYSASSDGCIKGTLFSGTEGNDSSEIGNIFCGSSTSASSLMHVSLNTHNYLSAVVTVNGER